MILTATTGTYIDPSTLGQYPNAYIDYMGDRHFEEEKKYVFRFTLNTENDNVFGEVYWHFDGITPSGNTIQNHGEIISGGTSGATEIMDFVDFTLADGDYDYSGHTINTYPVLSYEDIDTYFILGNKKEKVQLPSGANPKKLVKWMLLNTNRFQGELSKEQFSW